VLCAFTKVAFGTKSDILLCFFSVPWNKYWFTLHTMQHTATNLFMLHMWLRVSIRMDQSCYTYGLVLSHVWMADCTFWNMSGRMYESTILNTLPQSATRFHAVQHSATHCNILQHDTYNRKCLRSKCRARHHAATHFNTLQQSIAHCNTLQHTATHCNTLQHTATHCNTITHDTYIKKSRSWKMQRTTSCCNTL